MKSVQIAVKKTPDGALLILAVLFARNVVDFIEVLPFNTGLGVHLSKVRSVDLDLLTEENYLFLKNWGNLKANWYWEGKGNCTLRESSDSFIRGKYEFRRYCREGPIPDPNLIHVGSVTQTQSKSLTSASRADELLDFGNMEIAPQEINSTKKLAPVQNLFASFEMFSDTKPSTKKESKLNSNDILGLFTNDTEKKSSTSNSTYASNSSTGLKEEVTHQKKSLSSTFDFFGETQNISEPSKTYASPMPATQFENPKTDLFNNQNSLQNLGKANEKVVSKSSSDYVVSPYDKDNATTNFNFIDTSNDTNTTGENKTIPQIENNEKLSENEFGDFYSTSPPITPNMSKEPMGKLAHHIEPIATSGNEWALPDKLIQSQSPKKSPRKKPDPSFNQFIPEFQDNPWG
eukprot:NODE_3_length_80033_cov_0.932970.p17 type:complete len:403 gc:universal NODE_3_length_80033_cov_0.932970:6348-5140(-)